MSVASRRAPCPKGGLVSHIFVRHFHPCEKVKGANNSHQVTKVLGVKAQLPHHIFNTVESYQRLYLDALVSGTAGVIECVP